MDEIIYLEQDEEIPSVIDKLRNIEGKSIALVVPKEAAVLQSVINLKILKREAENLEKEISLVTQDKIGRNLASQVGLSVYDNIQSNRPIIQSPRPEPEVIETIELDMSEKKEIKPPSGVKVNYYQGPTLSESNDKLTTQRAGIFGLTKPQVNNDFDQTSYQEPEKGHISARSLSTDNFISSSNYQNRPSNQYQSKQIVNHQSPDRAKQLRSKKLKLFLGLLILLLIMGLFYFYYLKAVVILAMTSEPLEKNIDILVDSNITKLDIDRSAISGELQETEKESKQTYSATGTKDVGEKTTGVLKVTNPTGDQQIISSGTEFKSADNLSFLATESITVPKATASVDSLGNVVKLSGTANIKVQAKEAGENYNVSPTSFVIIGNSRITAENIAVLTGGSSRKVTIISEDDVNKAKDALFQQLQEDNKNELIKKSDPQTIDSNSISHNIVSFNINKNIGDEIDSFEATLKLHSRTLSFLENDYRQMIADILNKELSSDKELLLSENDEITTNFNQPDYSTGIMTLNGKVKTNMVTKINDEDLKKNITGKNKTNSLAEINKISGVSSAQINLQPSWWWKIPKKIEIKKEIR